MSQCAGWEQLPHDTPEEELLVVGGGTRLCKECHSRFQREPNKDELVKYL